MQVCRRYGIRMPAAGDDVKSKSVTRGRNNCVGRREFDQHKDIIDSRLPTQQHLRRSGLGMRGIILPMDVGSRLDPITVGTSWGRAS